MKYVTLTRFESTRQTVEMLGQESVYNVVTQLTLMNDSLALPEYVAVTDSNTRAHRYIYYVHVASNLGIFAVYRSQQHIMHYCSRCQGFQAFFMKTRRGIYIPPSFWNGLAVRWARHRPVRKVS